MSLIKHLNSLFVTVFIFSGQQSMIVPLILLLGLWKKKILWLLVPYYSLTMFLDYKKINPRIIPKSISKLIMNGFHNGLETWHGKVSNVNYHSYSGNKLIRTYLPHGIHPVGMSVAQGGITNNQDNFSFLIVPGSTKVPMVRELCLFSQIVPSDHQTISNLMKSGQNLALYPGTGFEMILNSVHRHRIYVGKKGFVKYALRYGYDLQPIYVFGESNLYHNFSYFENYRLNLFKRKNQLVPAYLWWGSFWVIPKKQPLMVVHGEIIKNPFESILDPLDEEIEIYHNLYLNEIKRIFLENISKWKEIDPKSSECLEIYDENMIVEYVGTHDEKKN